MLYVFHQTEFNDQYNSDQWSVISDITFDDVDDAMNNQDMAAIEHEMLVESEKETVTDCFNLLGISPIKVHRKLFRSRKSC